MLRKKFDELVTLIEQGNDKELLETVHYAIESCGQYIEAVNAMEAIITVQKFRMEPEDYRAFLMEADKRRRNIHNGLIANVAVLNRICKMFNVSEIFEGDIEKRIEVAEFAAKVVNEMFETRKL